MRLVRRHMARMPALLRFRATGRFRSRVDPGSFSCLRVFVIYSPPTVEPFSAAEPTDRKHFEKFRIACAFFGS